MDRLIFLHIPKTAGTAFHNVLMRHFRPEELCPERLRFLDRLSDEELARYRFYSGHYYIDQTERIPAPKTLITLLRDPRKRLLSLYYFFRAHRWETIEQIEELGIDSPRPAKERALGEYLRSAETEIRNYTDNAITRHLIGLRHIGPDGRLLVSGEAAVGLAIENLQRRFAAFGVVEQYAAARERLAAATGLDLPAELPRDNDFESVICTERCEFVPRQESFDTGTEAEIERCIALDNRVYDWAARHC